MRKSCFRFKLLLLLSCAAAMAGCRTPEQPPELQAQKVVKPLLKDTTYTHEYVADIHSVKFVEVRSRVRGYLEKIHVDEGQPVTQGQLLFTLSGKSFEKQRQQADAAYKSSLADEKAAEVELKNVRLLAAKNIVSAAEVAVTKAKAEALHADVAEARAAKEQAELALTFAKVTAPFNGTINRIPKKVGSLIEEADKLTTISDNSEVYAYFNLSEIDYLNYMREPDKEWQIVHLKLANNEMYPHAGAIEMVESEFDRATGNIAFRAHFPNPDGVLKHGSNAKIVIHENLTNALFIPQKSTFDLQDKLYVYVVTGDGVLKQRNVVPKMRFPHFYAIESGLSADDRIVYEGVENLRDGDVIKPDEANLSQLMTVNSEP